jgi:hypothetical protein
LQEWWPFDADPRRFERRADPSVWQLLLGDRVALGAARLGVLALTVFVVVSVPALIVTGRWLKAFGAGGVSVEAADVSATIRALKDETHDLRDRLKGAERQARRLTRERDEARRVALQIRVELKRLKEQKPTQRE